jgi:hypothetical protein
VDWVFGTDKAGNHLATQSCSFSLTDTDPETGHLVRIEGDVEVFFPPGG